MKLAFVTPTYRGDYERCKLLCESTSRFLPKDSEHILIVDQRDISFFKGLENSTVRIVVSESLMPWWIFRLPGVKKWSFSLRTLPIRNWIYQQLLKISSVYATDADIIQFIDSDVTLIRPFPLDYIHKNDRFRLQRVNYIDPDQKKWANTAATLLGVEIPDDFHYSYVGNLITWTRPNILGLIERLEEVAKSSWVSAVGNQVYFSEYMLYGIYVDYVLGIEASGQYHDDSPNLHLCWDYDLRTQQGMKQFFSEINPDNLGIMIHSKYNIPVELYRDHVKSLFV
ncbi:DUF6492 family protein [Gloeothece verrucosa]|uniref:Glycosyl transferase family 8 n=1 Tax=Gloeothece verrucosa (strain PCC 7822) TaxID=497965 RepID=E0UAD7_GLOV7|nr:DUF6492 family protein [Gloeothece verrucosa]ADN17442.1 conserved hypothetical protein [Gloeothece verrucosa PCC 7822]